MKKQILFIILFFIIIKQTHAQVPNIQAAKKVLERTLGAKVEQIELEFLNGDNQNDYYEYQAKNGKLIIKGNTPTALTRGVYDYLKNNHLGMEDWAGNNFKIPAKLPESAITKVVSPYKIRQAYNVVTAGYTTPFWNWERWQRELDWQALHGFNMLMAPIATEAIATRVWKKLGLTQKEIDSFYVTPSLLPWQRMGNIQNVGGSLSSEWHVDQIELQHKVLERMRELGMQPILQSFAGFVPKAIKRLYPNLALHNTLWNNGFPESQRPVMLMPGDPLFTKITKMYMDEWKAEFGEAKYYLVDSFNELELPKTDQPITEVLANYGKFTYDAIKEANPNAVWVIQGWMFGYQRKQWPPENVKALFSNIPDNKILILDYANDYANSWEPVNGFNGKQWVYGFVPNMGGKTAYTGNLNLYATGAANTLASPKKNNLIGFSISGEGLENNNVIYELLTDVAWSNKPIQLDNWLKEYSINRYGSYPKEPQASWDLLRKSSYHNLIDHPQFNWQLGKFKINNINRSDNFFKSVELFLSCRNVFKNSKNYKADAIERSAILLGLKAENWFEAAGVAYEGKNVKLGDSCFKKAIDILYNIDRLMESHPLNKLSIWVDFAKQHSKDPILQKQYAASAKRIVTIWGPPVNDYSCRIWSGLIRDFYIPRMQLLLEFKKTGKVFDKSKWELNWVDNAEIDKIKTFEKPVETAANLVQQALHENISQMRAN